MDTGDTDDTVTMEIDGEAAAMETNEAGEGMVEDSTKMGDATQVAQPELCQVWQRPEGVCSKKIIQKGQGLASPVMGAVCTLSLQAPENHIGFDATITGYPLGESSIQIGEGDTPVSYMIDLALMTMKRGESSEVSMSRMHGLGDITLIVSLRDFSAAVPYWRMTIVEKRTAATHHKERGAQLFKDGRVEAAFVRFRQATQLLLSVPAQDLADDDEATIGAYQILLCQCYLNLAACQIKTGHHRHVITNCTSALELDPSNVKAHYRRATAHVGLGDYDSARGDLEKGLNKEPCNRVLLELLQMVNSHIAQSDSQMAQGLSKMFT
ncbi:hypothetical protein BaRGS_00006118 [Batillaria attramentaria]|uniref:Peptidylprolyl isomerase n=1 Tax=Batillaria attramentaria TaxID=370345 RepID=A0ABD0LU54_9CAEN|nr:hypothetical protein BaRGS_013236 [Batillaria attramentaria]KAG5710592.1 hypothetical protein BaRGS_013238 [Batillaria attramentaria]